MKKRMIGTVILSMLCTLPASAASITVHETGSGEIMQAQVITPDRGSETGWRFTQPVFAESYKKALGITDEQELIRALMAAADPDYAAESGRTPAQAGALALALSEAWQQGTVYFEPAQSVFSVEDAGLYAVHVAEEGYTYGMMSAYAGFGPAAQGEVPQAVDTEITAKKTENFLDKQENEDSFCEIGGSTTFTIRTCVPYVEAGKIGEGFYLYDHMSGGHLDREQSVRVTLEDEEMTDIDPVYIAGPEGEEWFYFDLSSFLEADAGQAGKTVSVTYTAVMDDVQISNTAQAGIFSESFDSSCFGEDDAQVYSGSLLLTKLGEGDSLLADAGFLLYHEAEGERRYAVLDEHDVLTGWTEEAENATEIFTGEGGSLQVSGLDLGTYHFKEVTAPQGYSVNTADAEAVLALEEGTKASGPMTVSVSMRDTRLHALPHTGGMGTAFFSLAGFLLLFTAFKKKKDL